jgi:putative radical SAM enzyme (TIGR03279 family)
MKIIQISPDSPLSGKITVGSDLRAINGHPIGDLLDFQFHSTEEWLRLEIADQEMMQTIRVRRPADGDLGLAFEEGKIRICDNNCIFCFVHQQPKGMRRSLYIKDDDYRYSFTHGNFVSLSGMDYEDFERIISLRLSPLYISVHTTDDALRRIVFGNKKLEPILPRLQMLVENGIILHTQTVVCPGINEGAHLEKTIADLAALAPGIDSLAIVPVGLTRYRRRLPQLRRFTPAEARLVIDQIEGHHEAFLDSLGTRFVYPADEFFLLAGRPLPPLRYYEEMPQFENGVGMVRQFVSDFNRRKRYLPRAVKRRLRLALVTGRLAEPILRDLVTPVLAGIKNLAGEMRAVDNRFWGKTVTVTGLLTGKDIIRAVNDSRADLVILPPNCLNVDHLFLDDMSLEQFTEKLDRPVVVGSYHLTASIRAAVNLWES